MIRSISLQYELRKLLAAFLVLSIVLSSVIIIPHAYAFQTRVMVPIFYFIGLPIPIRVNVGGAEIHQEITQHGLSFLKPNVIEEIVDEHPFVEVRYPFSYDFHFDSCRFSESTMKINELYQLALGYLNPSNPRNNYAQNAFGQLLHPVQDFYSHSNWIELGKNSLIDNNRGPWTVLTPFSTHNGVMVIEGEQLPTQRYAFSLNGKVVNIQDRTNQQRGLGLISGSALPQVREVSLNDGCPDSIALSHGILNKDEPSKPGHFEAKQLAISQTTHEWCRLVNLVEQRYGTTGKQILINNWVANPSRAEQVCNIPASQQPSIPVTNQAPEPRVETGIEMVDDGTRRNIGNYGFTSSNSMAINFRGSIVNNLVGDREVVGFECNMDNPTGGFSPCTSPVQMGKLLPNSTHVFQVRAVDNIGNRDSTPAVFIWYICETSENMGCQLYDATLKKPIVIPAEKIQDFQGPVEKGKVPVEMLQSKIGLQELAKIPSIEHQDMPKEITGASSTDAILFEKGRFGAQNLTNTQLSEPIIK